MLWNEAVPVLDNYYRVVHYETIKDNLTTTYLPSPFPFSQTINEAYLFRFPTSRAGLMVEWSSSSPGHNQYRIVTYSHNNSSYNLPSLSSPQANIKLTFSDFPPLSRLNVVEWSSSSPGQPLLGSSQCTLAIKNILLQPLPTFSSLFPKVTNTLGSPFQICQRQAGFPRSKSVTIVQEQRLVTADFELHWTGLRCNCSGRTKIDH